VHFDEGPNGSLVVEVKQTVRYFKGNPVQEKGLRNKTVGHIFHFAGAKVVRFDIREEE
jgi:hypothetical protein